jgi:DNA-binding transcriptional ArsR family regulator
MFRSIFYILADSKAAASKIFMPSPTTGIFVPAKDVARLLNNESNLKILDKLKVRPYYPRELAKEMSLSEPFVVRRLKAMEEEGIVEGRWETEGSRKVKRYYLMDVTIGYGKDGLQVSSEEIPAPAGIDMKKELAGRLLKLPLVIIFVIGIVFNIQIIIWTMMVFILWYLGITVGFWLRCRFNTTLLSIPVCITGIITLITIMAGDSFDLEVPVALLMTLVAVVLAFVLLYQARYYQLEMNDLIRENRIFVKSLEMGSWPVKIFYLPLVLRWKLCEYFGLV